jgi:hypothetical protein
MEIEAELLKEHSRRQADRIVAWIGADAKRLKKLMDLFLEGEYLVTQRSAMAVGIFAERHPALVAPYLGRMLALMEEPGVHVAVRRCVVRILRDVHIPAGQLARVANLCFGYIASGDSPVAVKAFAMTVLARIARSKPDLGRELRLVIEQQLPYGSSGFRSCAARILRELAAGPGSPMRKGA